jgi:hypothetical protein
MEINRSAPTVTGDTQIGAGPRHGIERTGVRFVLSNVADPTRADQYNEWYDAYAANLTLPGFLGDALRFENPGAGGNNDDPRYAAVYEIVTPDPGTAWPQTLKDPAYPTRLFGDPRNALVVPTFRASYELVGSLDTPGEHGALTGTYIVLTDGVGEASCERWAAEVLDTGLFYAASRFRIIEGDPAPPDWLEIFETDQQDPLTAYARSLEALAPRLPTAEVRRRYSGSFRLVSAYPPGP